MLSPKRASFSCCTASQPAAALVQVPIEAVTAGLLTCPTTVLRDVPNRVAMYPNSRSPWAAWFRFMKSKSMLSQGNSKFAWVCKCSNGFASAVSPAIHIFAGLKVCIHTIIPTTAGSALASNAARRIAAESVSTGFHTTVTGMPAELARTRAICREPDRPVLAMGDFNDEPFDPSLVIHAASTRQREKVVNATPAAPRLWNLMWPPMGTPDGSFYFDNQPNQLDQFLVNTNMAEATSPLRAEPDTVQTLKFPETVDGGDYPKPRPFGGMGKPIDQDGYSDHFPIGMRVKPTEAPSRSDRHTLRNMKSDSSEVSAGSLLFLGLFVLAAVLILVVA